MAGFLGVLGGMGPLATADFLAKLARKTPAKTDQLHIPVLLYGDCTIPDRTASIIGQGPSPEPQLLRGIEFLNDSGVRAICIPCNSAHCWFDQMQSASDVPLLHIVRSSAEQVRRKNARASRVGVLSTLGTHRMGIYRESLQALGFEVLSPTDEEFDNLVSPGIAMIKANEFPQAEEVFAQAAGRLFDRGAEIIILGCTEIPSGMAQQCAADPERFVDSNDALVDAAIQLYYGQASPNASY